MKYKKIIRYPLSFALMGFLFQDCSSPKAEAVQQSQEKNEPVTQAFVLQKGQLSSSLALPGELIAYQQVDLYAKISSFVNELKADVGTEVKKGQLLVTMEAPEIDSQLNGLQSRLKSAEAMQIASKAKYNRLLEASKTPGTVSPNDLDMALAQQESDAAQYEAAKAAYREVGANKNYLEIRAPFDGIITARNVSPGAYVGPSGKGSEMPLFTLQEQKKLRLVVAVPDSYSSYLVPGTPVNFSVKSLPGEEFSGHISRLAGALDQRLRSQRVEVDVKNENKKLLPGMIVQVSIPLPSQESTFVVPESAVVNSAEGIYLIKANQGQVHWVPVEMGRTIEGKSEVFGKLAEGDTLVAKVSEEIRDNSKLGKIEMTKPIESMATPPPSTMSE